MSSASTLSRPIPFSRVENLKRELVKFATTGPLKDQYKFHRKLFFESGQPEDAHEAESVLDWFLFEWLDQDGAGSIDYFLDHKPNIDEADREILLDWLDSINSVFEIHAINERSLELKDLDGGECYTVKISSRRLPFKRGQLIVARLLPLKNEMIFSGLQFLMPNRESALAWLEMRRSFDLLDSPEALERARREQVAAFCELFGCDELTVASSKLNSTLERFQRHLLTERRDPQTGLTPAEKFKKELGQDLSVPDLPQIPEPLAGAGEVTILCDEFDGIVLLPDFNRFKRVFEAEEPDRQVPDWRDLVWTYIKNPEIPIVAFERVAEKFPRRVEKAMRSLIGDKDFSLEHLYAVLLHYKQPVEGLDDLRDDQQLWDLFNGNTDAAKAKPRGETRKPKGKKAAKKTAAKLTSRSRGLTPKREAKKRATPAKRVAQSRKASAKRR
jgi:hypothetical protein